MSREKPDGVMTHLRNHVPIEQHELEIHAAFMNGYRAAIRTAEANKKHGTAGIINALERKLTTTS